MFNFLQKKKPISPQQDFKALYQQCSDHYLDTVQKLRETEDKLAILGTALVSIMHQETPVANATVKRMAALAKQALNKTK